jgi:RNA ligase (TIGR02306 family)
MQQQPIRLPVTDWMPQVVKVCNVVHHPAADSLDVVTVLKDYPVVVQRAEYKPGDLASYIPIDSIVPDTEQFYHLCPRANEKYEVDGVVKNRMGAPKFPLGSVPEKHRILKAKKIRGVYSQGMLIPAPEGLKECDSVTDVLGLKKWSEVEEENIPGLSNEYEEPPVGWSIPFYDVNGVRRFLDRLQDGEEVIITEKIHGSNAAFVHDGTRLWVKSRNFYKQMRPRDPWWGIATRYDLEQKLRPTPHMVVFGEIYGLMSGFKYDTAPAPLSTKIVPKILFFDVWDVDRARFLPYDDRLRFLAERGLDPVPLLYRGPWLGRDAMYALAEGPTMVGAGKHVREGWVLTTAQERYDPVLQARMQVKLVGEGYNLQK